MNFDYDILKSFLPEEDQKDFIKFESIISPSPFKESMTLVFRVRDNSNGFMSTKKTNIIKISDYLQKVRDQKLNQILK